MLQLRVAKDSPRLSNHRIICWQKENQNLFRLERNGIVLNLHCRNSGNFFKTCTDSLPCSFSDRQLAQLTLSQQFISTSNELNSWTVVLEKRRQHRLSQVTCEQPSPAHVPLWSWLWQCESDVEKDLFFANCRLHDAIASKLNSLNRWMLIEPMSDHSLPPLLCSARVVHQ